MNSKNNESHQSFNDGFREGFKTIMGNMVLVPLAPLAPLTPLGSTPYREVLKQVLQQLTDAANSL